MAWSRSMGQARLAGSWHMHENRRAAEGKCTLAFQRHPDSDPNEFRVSAFALYTAHWSALHAADILDRYPATLQNFERDGALELATVDVSCSEAA